MNEPVSPVINLLGGMLLLGSLGAWLAIGLTLRERRALIEFSPRRPAPWSGTDVLLLAVTFLGFEFLAAGFARGMAGDDDGAVLIWILAFQSVARVLWFLFAVAHLRLRGASPADLGWNRSFALKDIASGGWLFLAAIVPVLLVQLFFTQILEIPSEHPLLKMAQDGSTLPLMIGATIAAVGIAPWFEEFVFRVVLQGWLEGEQVRLRRQRELAADSSEPVVGDNPYTDQTGLVGPGNDPSDGDHSDGDHPDGGRPGYAPLIVASVVFAGMHFSAGPDPVAIFVLSLFLGYAYRQTHRILPSIAIHAGLNGWTMLNLWIMYLSA